MDERAIPAVGDVQKRQCSAVPRHAERVETWNTDPCYGGCLRVIVDGQALPCVHCGDDGPMPEEPAVLPRFVGMVKGGEETDLGRRCKDIVRGRVKSQEVVETCQFYDCDNPYSDGGVCGSCHWEGCGRGIDPGSQRWCDEHRRAHAERLRGQTLDVVAHFKAKLGKEVS